MTVVTGASGFLGRHVVHALQKNNSEFVCWVRSRRSLEDSEKKRIQQINFLSVPEMKKALQGVEQVLHLAGQINGRTEELEETNLGLTKRLVEASKRAGVRRILFMSSAAVHLRKGPYGKTKWEAEEFLKSSGIPYLIFRPALIYGPGDSKNVAVMEKLIKCLPLLPLVGGGKFLIQPVYMEDVVTVLMCALESPVVNQSYYLAGPSQISLKEMLEILAASLERRVKFFPLPLKPVQSFARLWAAVFPGTRLPVKQILELDQHSAFDIQETRKDFGFSPRTFREGVSAMRNSEALCVG